MTGVSYASFGDRLRVRPIVPVLTVVALLLFSLLRIGVVQMVSANQAAALSNSATTSFIRPIKKTATTPTAPQSASSGASTTPTSAQPKPQTTPSLAVCTKDTGYGTPDAVDLNGAQPGLTQVVDAPEFYQIYGYSAQQIEAQIHACAPNLSGSGDAAEFTGETGYRLNWQYSFAVNDAGLCTVTDAKVGQHINMVLPQWQSSPYADAGLAQKWQNFAAALQTHENGHVALDKQRAATLLADLQNFPPTDCAVIAQSVSYLVNADVATLNQANDNYDTQTNHGATQGAILP